MKVIPSVVDSTTVINSTVENVPAEVYSLYSSVTTYNINDVVTFTNGAIYQSKKNGNIGKNPTISGTNYDDWWKFLRWRPGAWDVAFTFASGTKATYNRRTYQSLQAANLGNDPTASPTWWLDVGPDNVYAMFDTLRNTPTTYYSPIEVVVTPGYRIDTLAAIGLVADSIRVRVVTNGSYVSYGGDGLVIISDPSQVAYDSGTIRLINRVVDSWSDYFFGLFVQNNAYIFENLPQYATAVIILTFYRAYGQIEIGNVTPGMAVNIGAIQYGADDDAENFSTIIRDIYGNATLVQRQSIPQTNQTVWAPKASIPQLHVLREALRAKPVVWSGLDDATDAYFPSLLINGIYRKFTINIAHTDVAVLTLQLEEI